MLPLALSLYVSISSVLAVDVEFRRTPPEEGTIDSPLNIQRCRDLPPGACCMPRRNFPSYMAAQFGLPAAQQADYNRVAFTDLEPGHVTAAFVPRAGKVGCDATIRGTGWGPGTWTFDLPYHLSGDHTATRISGASYIAMPKTVPFDDATSAWLSAEGMVGLVWPKGNWFTPDVGSSARSRLLEAAAALLHEGSSLEIESKKGRKRKRRNVNSHIRSAERGAVFCRGPRRWVWVDVIRVNGTEFVAEEGGSGKGKAIYRSGDGRVLNFTEGAS
ncbi:MAG: hypothetical protein Q9228_002980 [Teloschistes exilis]